MNRLEYQIKVEGALDLSLLQSLGAERLGQTQQQDIYLAGDQTRRIREESGRYHYAEKKHDTGKRARVKEVSEHEITKKEADRLKREAGVLLSVYKSRTLYRLHDVVLAIDEVEHLGEFVELRSRSEDHLFAVLKQLDLNGSEAIKESYLDLMVAKKLPKWLQRLLPVHDRIGELVFGITSGIMTTIGVIVGVSTASESQLALVASITAIAVSDSWSDAFGIYTSKLAERGTTQAEALQYASGTLMGKIVMPLTFIIPILLLPIETALIVDICWGAIALSLLSVEQALVTQQSIIKITLRNLLIAAFIMFLASVAGLVINRLFRL